MSQYGLLIDYEYCTNCHSCEVACEEAHDFPPEARGIRSSRTARSSTATASGTGTTSPAL